MPTSKPRVTFTLSEDELECITNYQHGQKIKNQTQAILSLIRLGLHQVNESEHTHSFLEEVTLAEKTLLQNYRKLNKEGREKLADYADDLIGNNKYITSEKERAASAG